MMKNEPRWSDAIACAAALAAVTLAVPPAGAKTIHVDQSLAATGVDDDAAGQVKVRIRQHGNDLSGRLDVKVKQLDPNQSYEVVLAGVRIGTLTTTGGGNGRARFRTRPRGNDQLLGTDPRSMQVEVRNDAGDDVLETDIPGETMDPTKIRCCLTDDGDADEQPECEDRTADECTAAGGVDLGAGSCMPNPCEASPPPASDDVVCCTAEDDDDGPECEVRSPAGCSEHGGINLGAGVCSPNPCTPTTPPAPETIQCCLAHGGGGESEVECEDRTPDRCAAEGGTDMGPGSCTPDPCQAAPPPAGDIRCCETKHDGVECEQRSPEECTARGGTDLGAGSCDPNPCS